MSSFLPVSIANMTARQRAVYQIQQGVPTTFNAIKPQNAILYWAIWGKTRIDKTITRIVNGAPVVSPNPAFAAAVEPQQVLDDLHELGVDCVALFQLGGLIGEAMVVAAGSNTAELAGVPLAVPDGWKWAADIGPDGKTPTGHVTLTPPAGWAS